MRRLLHFSGGILMAVGLMVTACSDGQIVSSDQPTLRADGQSSSATVPVAAATFPETIPLPEGFRPEGIVTGQGPAFFVGSLASGAVYRGDLRTGAGAVLVPPSGDRVAIGLSYDHRSNYLFAAGGGTGMAYIYDAKTGELVASYELTDPGSFVNDVVVTTNGAYFTDSFAPSIYRIPLGPGGRLPDQTAVEEISLGGDFEFVAGPGVFNTNGIDAGAEAKYLIIVNSTTGLLYRVDPTSGDAAQIDLGGEELTAGDGILLDGQVLYVVRNRLNSIAVVKLEPGAGGGTVVEEITSSNFDVPTTIAEFGRALYAVNARFGTPTPDEITYDVVRIHKP